MRAQAAARLPPRASPPSAPPAPRSHHKSSKVRTLQFWDVANAPLSRQGMRA